MLRSEKAKLAFPIQTSRRDRRVRQPVEGDVFKNVVSSEALGLAVKDACDERIAGRVVVEHPGRQADRRIFNPVERLRAVAHLLSVAKAVLVEEVELIVRVSLVS